MRWMLGVGVLALGLAGCGAIDVKGIVRDDKTGEPLPGANVRIGDEATTTDLRGYYELEVDEEDGEPQKVSVQKAGYTGFTEQVTFDEDADEVFHDVELQKVERDAHMRGEPPPAQGEPEHDDDLGEEDDLEGQD